MRGGVSGVEFNCVSKRFDGFAEFAHFHQAAPEPRPARLVLWVGLEKLAESSHLALEDFSVVVGQLEKVTEVASARPAELRIAGLTGEFFGFALRRRNLFGSVWPANPSDSLRGDGTYSVHLAAWGSKSRYGLAWPFGQRRLGFCRISEINHNGVGQPSSLLRSFFRGLRNA